MPDRLSVAVIGSGISGLGAAWLLSPRHDVTVLEADGRPGGHCCTVDAICGGMRIPVDTGFIVYNPPVYPNLVALFDTLGVPTAPTRMSFAVSLDAGRYEYAGTSLVSAIGQPANLVRPGHWRMVRDVLRFFREAPSLLADDNVADLSLGAYLTGNGYSEDFIVRHILPMAAAIWSTPSTEVLAFPAKAFVRFFSNHGLLQARNQPIWRTVRGGSRVYVQRLLQHAGCNVVLDGGVRRISRDAAGVTVTTAAGSRRFDACVIATHADDALALLGDPSTDERGLLGAFRYQPNTAVLHRDPAHMPRRRWLWSSWNYLGDSIGRHAGLSVSYWMNSLQPLGAAAPDLFVTLNPIRPIAAGAEIARFQYRHPMFDAAAMRAQRELWRLQGMRRTWFAGSYFGYGFHEDGLQAGLAAAEDLGGVRRPWRVAHESSRIHLRPAGMPPPEALESAA
jgi:hypothetical protein